MHDFRHPLGPALLACSLLGGVAVAHAADSAALTIYRSDSAALYSSQGSSAGDDGYAIARERRTLDLAAGVHDVTIGDLPATFDPEAVSLTFPDGAAEAIAQRVVLASGGPAALGALLGRAVEVLGPTGQVLAAGTLLRADDGLRIADGNGHITLVRDYAAVRADGAGIPGGARLDVRVRAARAGATPATLTYPAGGLGWRAAYVGTLAPGAACRMEFSARASIANRSGKDWNGARVKLIAGEPNLAKASAPRPMMAMARGMVAAPAGDAVLPLQAGLDAYRSYTLPAALDLPDESVSQVPLYAPRSIACERTWLYTTGGAYQPPQPVTNPAFDQGGSDTVTGTLTLRAFDSLPAGFLRVLSADAAGTPQFIGEGRIPDTPKGDAATITLGTAFDLRAQRERTAFHVDAAARQMDEAFRVTLSNAGDTARTITVHERPQRWREWSLIQSSSRPTVQTPDLLEFRIDVPAHGERTLDYAVRYTWAPDVQPQ